MKVIQGSPRGWLAAVTLLAASASASSVQLAAIQACPTSVVKLTCTIAYNESVLSGCSGGSLLGAGTCSATCLNSINSVQSQLQSICAGSSVPSNSLLASILAGNLAGVLCPTKTTTSSSNAVVITSKSSTSSSATTSTTAKSTSRAATTSTSARTIRTTTSVTASTIQSSDSSSSTTDTATPIVSDSTMVTSTSGTATTATALSSSSSSSTTTSGSGSGGSSSGGGSPFDPARSSGSKLGASLLVSVEMAMVLFLLLR